MSNISIVNLSAYTSPVIQENKKGDYIEYGSDNNYFQYLIDRYLHSATNGAIITGIANMIYGKGLDALDSNKKPNEYAQMKSIIKDSDLRKIALERKLLGMASLQVVMEKKQVKQVLHFPMNTLRAGKCNDKGQIETWYYHHDWMNKKPSEEVKRIPAFGFGNGNEVEIYVIKPYVSGFDYYPPIDYSGALPYAYLEENIADYQINDVQNGFSGSKVINFNNGIPSEEMRDTMKRDVMAKLTGARGEKVIIAFNANAESKTTVEDLPLNDAPAHYEYLSKECFDKLIVGHRVTSPMLLGIRESNSGLSSNADEIETSTLMFLNLVIKPYQNEIITAIDTILAVNNISLDLRFIRLQPLDNEQIISSKNPIIEAVNSLSPLVANKVLESMTANEIRSLIGLGAEAGGSDLNPSVVSNLSKHLDDIDLDSFGEEIDLDEWELIDSREVDYDEEEELDKEIDALNNPKKSTLSKVWNFVSTGVAIPNAKSEQDGELFKSRYRYSGTITDKTRAFCKKMINSNKLYRKEDIQRMSNSEVNAGFGPEGADTYDVFLYKGGGACHHFWTRETYRKKSDVNNPNAEIITPAKARKEGEILPTNNPLVYQKPINMPNKGFLPK
jgi:hypothetical protein